MSKGINPVQGKVFQPNMGETTKSLSSQAASTKSVANKIAGATNPYALKNSMASEMEAAVSGLMSVVAKQAKDQKDLADSAAVLSLQEQYAHEIQGVMDKAKTLDGAALLDFTAQNDVGAIYDKYNQQLQGLGIDPKKEIHAKGVLLNMNLGTMTQVSTMRASAIKQTAHALWGTKTERFLEGQAANGVFMTREKAFLELSASIDDSVREKLNADKQHEDFDKEYDKYFSDYASNLLVNAMRTDSAELALAGADRMKELAADENSGVDVSVAKSYEARFLSRAEEIKRKRAGDEAARMLAHASITAAIVKDAAGIAVRDTAEGLLASTKDTDALARTTGFIDKSIAELQGAIQAGAAAGKNVVGLVEKLQDVMSQRLVVEAFAGEDVRGFLRQIESVENKEEFIESLADKLFGGAPDTAEGVVMVKAKEKFVGVLKAEANKFYENPSAYLERAYVRQGGVDQKQAEALAEEKLYDMGIKVPPLKQRAQKTFNEAIASEDRNTRLQGIALAFNSTDNKVGLVRQEVLPGASPSISSKIASNALVFDAARRVKNGEDPLADGSDILNDFQKKEYSSIVSALSSATPGQLNYYVGSDHSEKSIRTVAAAYAADNVTADFIKRSVGGQTAKFLGMSIVNPIGAVKDLFDEKSPLVPGVVPGSGKVHLESSFWGGDMTRRYDMTVSKDVASKIDPGKLRYLDRPPAIEVLAKYAGIPTSYDGILKEVEGIMSSGKRVDRHKLMQQMGIMVSGEGKITDTTGKELSPKEQTERVGLFVQKMVGRSQQFLRNGGHGVGNIVLMNHPDGGLGLNMRGTDKFFGKNISEKDLPKLLDEVEKKSAIQGGVDAAYISGRNYVNMTISEIPGYAKKVVEGIPKASQQAGYIFHESTEGAAKLTHDIVKAINDATVRWKESMPLEGDPVK